MCIDRKRQDKLEYQMKKLCSSANSIGSTIAKMILGFKQDNPDATDKDIQDFIEKKTINNSFFILKKKGENLIAEFLIRKQERMK